MMASTTSAGLSLSFEYPRRDLPAQVHFVGPLLVGVEHAARVDQLTGAVALRPAVGRVVSPAIVRGQVEGGAVQGIGQALSERVVYDGETGQLLTASFMDYALPHVDCFRGFKTQFDTSVPCTTNALGAKGVGELGTIGATPTVVTAAAWVSR